MNIIHPNGNKVTWRPPKQPSTSLVSQEFAQSVKKAVDENFAESETHDQTSKQDANWSAVAHLYVGAEGEK
jgi:hypothetical protein